MNFVVRAAVSAGEFFHPPVPDNASPYYKTYIGVKR